MEKRRSRKTYNSEQLVDKVYELLVGDLMPAHRDWFGFRNYTGPTYEKASPYLFKVHAQLEHFYKRIITSRDKDFEVLKIEAFEAFKDSQNRFVLPRPVTRRGDLVLRRAREIVCGILGEFNYQEFSEYCTFGKKAAKHLPQRDSYLDKRVRTLNGSPSQFEWFKFVLGNDIHLNRACRRYLKKFRSVYATDLHAVPKSYKTARTIAPDTTIGGFLSRGLGAYIRARLEAGTKIHLSTQQAKHRRLALQASIDQDLATLDESKASDSFVWDHIQSLCPESWLPALDVVRTKYVQLSETEFIPLNSVMLMGSGHTFPLQTLLFYGLTKAVIELSGSKRQVHVYGDDIIVPTKYAVRVMTSLEDLGFTVNRDKSFWTGSFRESCGGDFHTGVDVRPFMLEHVTGEIQQLQYVALIHKICNGLLERWEPCEIQETYSFLMAELVRVQKRINVVPRYEGPDSGVYYSPPAFEAFTVKPYTCLEYGRAKEGLHPSGLLCYYKLVSRPRKRKPKDERVYYWYALRPKGVTDPYEDSSASRLNSQGAEDMKGSHRYRWVANT